MHTPVHAMAHVAVCVLCVQAFPEVDRVEWMPLARARPRLAAGQRSALDRLASFLAP